MAEWGNLGKVFIGVGVCVALVGLLMILYLTSSVLPKSVRERLAEFATLKSFGFSDWLVIGLVGAEAALPCLVGAVCGVAVAGVLAHQIPALMPPDAGIPLPTISPVVFFWALIVTLSAAATSVAAIVNRFIRPPALIRKG